MSDIVSINEVKARKWDQTAERFEASKAKFELRLAAIIAENGPTTTREYLEEVVRDLNTTIAQESRELADELRAEFHLVALRNKSAQIV